MRETFWSWQRKHGSHLKQNGWNWSKPKSFFANWSNWTFILGPVGPTSPRRVFRSLGVEVLKSRTCQTKMYSNWKVDGTVPTYGPFTNLPFGICAIYFDLKVFLLHGSIPGGMFVFLFLPRVQDEHSAAKGITTKVWSTKTHLSMCPYVKLKNIW